jgi:hypothetical protein
MLGSSLSARLTGAGPAGARLGHYTGLVGACLPGRAPRCGTPAQDHVADAALDQTRQPRPNSPPVIRAASPQAGDPGKRDFSDPASPSVPCRGERTGVAHVVQVVVIEPSKRWTCAIRNSSVWPLKGSAMPLTCRPMPIARQSASLRFGGEPSRQRSWARSAPRVAM